MDELKQAWLDLESAEYTDHELKNEEIMYAIHASSKSTMQKMAAKINGKFWHMALAIPFIAGCIVLLSGELLHIVLAIILGIYLIGAIALYMEYRDLKKGVPMDENLLSNLKHFRQKVKKAIRIEQITNIVVYPFSAIAGYTVATAILKPGIMPFQDTRQIVVMAVALLILVPAGYYMLNWVNKRTFSKYLHELDENIDQLES